MSTWPNLRELRSGKGSVDTQFEIRGLTAEVDICLV
jgi:hypothetical protein